MTTTDLSRYIGLECLWTTGGLDILVRVLDVKRAYGRTRYLITPLASLNPTPIAYTYQAQGMH